MIRSIERYLLAWIIGALTLGSIVVALVMYLVLLDEMNEVFDDHLKNVANAVARYHHAGHVMGDGIATPLPIPGQTLDGAEIVTLTWTPSGERVYASDKRVDIPFSTVEGLTHPSLGGEAWILYTSVHREGVVQAAQRAADREHLAGESAVKIFIPLFGLVVLVGALMVFALRRGLQPLDAAARDIALRSAKALLPITADDVPREIAPVVASINGLMGRLSEAMATQQRFIADAAHELRSPATALRLQLQLLQRSSDEPARANALSGLEAGIDRTQHLIEQLLQVARAEHDAEQLGREAVSLGELARTVVGNASIQADHSHIDLGVTGTAVEVTTCGDRYQLAILLTNLVENALRYTPAGGVVDVGACLHKGQPALFVIDNGPGIPESERERVFDRFHRGEDARVNSRDGGGSGLGLAIVRAIADRHGASVTLHTPASGEGLEVRVVFGASALGDG